MTRILPLLLIQMVIKLGMLDSQAALPFILVSRLGRCFKDLKTKCTKDGKELPQQRADGESKAVVPPSGFRENVVYTNVVNHGDFM